MTAQGAQGWQGQPQGDEDDAEEPPRLSLRERILDLAGPKGWTAMADSPPGLACTLKPYQQKAVAWMLAREEGIDARPGLEADLPPDIDNEHHMLHGGLLADEMGLGKTVETIAVLLHRPFHPDAEAHATREEGPALGGTLIVTPPAIRRQWQQEMLTHAPDLTVEVYEGLKYYKQEDGNGTQRSRTPKSKKARMDAAQEQWERLQQLTAQGIANGTVDMDARTEAVKEVGRLRKAHVVLTTYDVLQREVYFSPNVERISSLRSEKRYQVPESPLLTIRWMRTALDEAQKAGTGPVALMTQRLQAQHRWVVTGTPLGRGGLKDIHALFRALHHHPLGLTPKWLPTEEQLAAGGEVAWSRLRHLLRPIMWRSTKLDVASELHLPSCSVEVDRLRFTPGEWTFYQRILDDTRAFIQSSDAGKPISPLDKHGRQRRGPQKGDKLALDQLLQLRYCCDHPQLTLYWRRLSAELQLQQGGALSMGEMMGRMADEAAGLLQGSERQLCAHLNALAVLTLDASAQPDTPGKGRQAPAGDSSDPPPTPKQKRSSRPFKSGAASPKAGSSHDSAQQAADGQQPGWTAEALQAAEGWLQQSRTVGEHGIAELEGKGKGFGSMALTSASHRAWRLIQVNTLTHLAKVLRARATLASEGNEAAAAQQLRQAAEDVLRDAKAKSEDVVETPALGLAAAKSAHESCVNGCNEAADRAVQRWKAAGEEGFLPGMPGSVEAWAQDLRARFAQAQESERAARLPVDTAEGTQQVLLGTVVEGLLSAEPPKLQGIREGLEGLFMHPRAAAAARCLRTALPSLERGNEGPAMPQPGFAEVAHLPWPIPMQVDDKGHVTWPALNQGDEQAATMAADALALTIPNSLLDRHQVTKSVQRAIRALEKQHKKLMQQAAAYLERIGVPAAQGPTPGVARLAYEGVQAQLDVIKRLRDTHLAELKSEVAQSDLDSLRTAVADAAEGIPEIAQGKGVVALKHEIERLRERCLEQLQRQRFLENQRVELHPQEDQPSTTTPSADGSQVGNTDATATVGAFHQSEQLPNKSPDEPPNLQGSAQTAPPDVCATVTPMVYEASSQPGEHSNGSTAPANTPDQLQAAVSKEGLPLKRHQGVNELPQAKRVRLAHEQAAAGLEDQPETLPLDGQDQPDASLQPAHARAEAEKATPVLLGTQQLLAASQNSAGSSQTAIYLHANAAVPEQSRPRAGRSNPDVNMRLADAEEPVQHSTVEADGAGPSSEPAQGSTLQQGVLQCGICLDEIKGRFWLFDCGHYFCEKCSLQLFGEARKARCPRCRGEVRADRVFRGAASARTSHGAMLPWEQPQYASVQVLGDWMSKIEGLIRRLVHFCKAQPDVKHLVFSQFPEALRMVAKALAVQQPPIACVSLLAGGSSSARSDAVQLFRSDERVRVFLLSLNAGAQGLTLVRASEVWLLEPSVDPAVEQQAIARVHRIGQVRPVVAHRLLIDGSIEEEVLRVAQQQHAGLGSRDAGGADAARGSRENLPQHQVRGLLEAALSA